MIEIIPKPAEKLPFWVNVLFYFFLGFLLITIVIYFILGHFLKQAETTLENLEKTLAKEKTAEEIALEEEVLSYQKKIEGFSKLINRHLFSSKAFEFIEKNTHPQVWFSQLDLNSRGGEVNLSGETDNFVTLHQQVQIFRTNPSVKNLDLAEIAIGKEGRIDFTLNLTFVLGFLK